MLMSIGVENRKYALGLARAFGGAIIFSFPLFMTMEMWLLGFYIDAFRLALFLLLTMPLLVGLSYYAGFANTLSWRDDSMDALSAYAVGFAGSAAMLFLMSIIELDRPWREVIGKITLQAVPASIGAMLARAQLGGDSGSGEQRKDAATFEGELFLMAAGALFLAYAASRLKQEGTTLASASVTFDYVPAHSSASGGMFFTRDPRTHQFRLDADAYIEP